MELALLETPMPALASLLSHAGNPDSATRFVRVLPDPRLE